jgi:hypothetical protein
LVRDKAREQILAAARLCQQLLHEAGGERLVGGEPENDRSRQLIDPADDAGLRFILRLARPSVGVDHGRINSSG